MIELKNVTESQYTNHYGGLSLCVSDGGDFYLEMKDCFEPSFYGPLTKEQVAAFYTIKGVKESDLEFEKSEDKEKKEGER